MSFRRWGYFILIVALVLIALLLARMHVAAAQGATPATKGNSEAGRLMAQAWCTECHSVQWDTAGTGKFAPDFTVAAGRRSARWLHAFLRRPHVKMPDFEFEPDAADDLVAYIVSLKRR
ncbi:MAG: cytochrome c [Xanthobacteraceae bacterium]|nr:cytochrome c [Xanthobacteraceae bacterium]